MKQTIERYGATFLLAITADLPKQGLPTPEAREALKQKVYGLYNFGVVSNIDDYDPTSDSHVVLSTDAGRMAKGFEAMAYAALYDERPRPSKKHARNLAERRALAAAHQARAKKLAESYVNEYEVVESFYRRPSQCTSVYSEDGNPVELGWTLGVSE